MSRAVAVFGSSRTEPGTDEWAEAMTVGARLAAAGYHVLTGGYGGSMEAVSRGASQAGTHVIGVTAPAIFPGRSGANRWVDETVESETLAHRIDLMVRRVSGAIALPGSIGTATELLMCWNTNHIVRRNGGDPLPCVAVGPSWRAVGEALALHVGASSSDIHWEDTASRAVDWLVAELGNP